MAPVPRSISRHLETVIGLTHIHDGNSLVCVSMGLKSGEIEVVRIKIGEKAKLLGDHFPRLLDYRQVTSYSNIAV